MCGIVGFLNTDRAPVSRGLLEEMTQSLAHRGPDGSGIEILGPVGFGHRRLSIIDPAGGRQPMFNEDGRIWVTFNGEIYNYRELRGELIGRGHHFVTNSDTETIVHAYEEWGERCVERFRGMFAFAVADHQQQKLFLARDHFGIKPLYYLNQGGVFAFASEMQALRRLPGIPWRLDLGALDQYLWLQYIPAPRTAFEQVRKLPPAHRMTVHFDGRTEGPQEYWTLAFEPDNSLSEEDFVEGLDEVLLDSVKAHLVSDVPFGAFLSGGVDSSMVLSYMTRILDVPVRAFSIGFNEAEFDETPYARFAAEKNRAQHDVEIVQPDAMGILPDLVRCYGDLFGDSSAVPTYYVSKLARGKVPMVLSGDGADELFAGYWSHGNWMRHMAHLNGYSPSLEDWLQFIAYIPTDQRRSLWRPEYSDICPAGLDIFLREFARSEKFSLCHRVQYMDLKTYLPYDILTKVDTASMMHGLEVRTPFVDIRVAEFARKVPERFNIRQGLENQWERKLLLKETAERYYPPEFLHRPKMGFAVPIAKWFTAEGSLRPVLTERLLGKGSMLHELFEPAAIASLIERNASGPLWLLLFLEEWLRQNRPSRDISPALNDVAGTGENAASVIDFVPGEMRRPATASPRNEAPQTRGLRPRILLVADVPNWIFERHCFTLQRLLSDEFDFDIVYDNQPYDEKNYDLIYPLEWYKVDPEAIGDPMKYISGIRSHLVWTECDFGRLTQMLRNRFNLIHVVSKRLHAIFAPALNNLMYASHGVDTGFFTPATRTDQSGRALRLGWAGNRKSVGKKGFAEFIEPLGTLPGVELVFCGYSDRNLTIGEMRDFYDTLDAYVCASDFEGNNNSLLEAASMARAIITTDNGTVPEYLRHGESALIVERNLRAFQDAVETLRDNPALRRRLGEKAREAVQDSWDWKIRGEEYRHFFRTALARQSVGRSTAADDRQCPSPAKQERILIACTHFWPSIGGVETIAEQLGSHLVERGHQVDVATWARSDRTATTHRGVTIIELGTTGTDNGIPAWVMQLRNLALSGDYAACILLADPRNLIIWSLEGAEMPAGTRLLIQPLINEEGFADWRDNLEFRSRLAAILKKADAVIAISREGAGMRYFREEGITPLYIPNAVERLAGADGFRSRHGIPCKTPLLLHVANLWPVKNHVGLLRALREMAGDWRLLMIGHPSEDAEYVDRVKAESALDPRTILIPGLPPEEVGAAMAEADIVLLASHGEVSPVTIMEAMSHGRPWLATPACGAVSDFAGGLVAPLELFPDVLGRLLQRPDLMASLGKAGRCQWQECFKWDRAAEAWEELIRSGSLKSCFEMPAEARQIMRSVKGEIEMNKTEQTSDAPVVTVIVPTYNRPDMLAATLRSILDQTYRNFEIIVVNDAGADVEGVVNFLNGDGKITYVRHAGNRGLAAARNTGLKLARGKYIAYLDDDDLFYPEHLETLVSFLNGGVYKVAYTDAHRAHQSMDQGRYTVVGRDVPYSYDFDYDAILVNNFVPVLCFMHEKSCIDEAGLFDETMTTHEDWDMWIRMSRLFRFAHLKKVTCEFTWRQDGSTMSSSKREDFIRTARMIYEKHHNHAVGKPAVLDGQSRALAAREPAGEEIERQGQIARQDTAIPPERTVSPDAGNALAIKRLENADSLAREGKFAEALASYQSILRADRTNHRALTGIGIVKLVEGKLDEAGASFAEALRLAPAYAKALAGFGMVRGAQGKDEEAFTSFARALDSDPENLTALSELVKTAYRINRFDEAEHYLADYLRYHPADLDMLFCQAGLLFQKGKFGEAMDAVDKLLIFAPDYEGGKELKEKIEAMAMNRATEYEYRAAG